MKTSILAQERRIRQEEQKEENLVLLYSRVGRRQSQLVETGVNEADMMRKKMGLDAAGVSAFSLIARGGGWGTATMPSCKLALTKLQSRRKPVTIAGRIPVADPTGVCVVRRMRSSRQTDDIYTR